MLEMLLALLLVPAAVALDLDCAGMRADRLLGVIAELGGGRIALDSDLLDAGVHAHAVAGCLHDADLDTTAQALACALDCSWLALPDGSRTLTRAATLPHHGTLSARVVDTRFRYQDRLAAGVRQLLAAHLREPAGLDYQPDLGRFSAVLDDNGHRRLRLVLSMLESAAADLPPVLPHPGDPLPGQVLLRQVECGPPWDAAVRNLAQQLARTVVLGTEAWRPQQPIVLPVGTPLTELPRLLSARGLPAQWAAGVLVLGDDMARDRRHPGQRALLGVIPGPQRDATEAALACAWVRTGIQREWWEQPGAGLLPIPDQPLLLASADAATLAAVHDALGRWNAP